MSSFLLANASQTSERLLRTKWRAPFCLFLVEPPLICCIGGCMAPIYNPFTDHRLVPLFLMLHGDPVYINSVDGPR